VKHAVDAFAVALSKEADPTAARKTLERLRDGGDGTPAVMNYCDDRFTPAGAFVDLYALLARAAACAELGDATRTAARDAMAATDALVIASFGMSGYAGFEPGKNGLFLHFPSANAARLAAVGGRRAGEVGGSWYSPLPHDSGRSHLGEWAWCRDGAVRDDRVVQNWFELLDAWFDDAPDGGANGWRY
jgi:clostripain